MLAVSAQGVRKVYGRGQDAVTALDDLDLGVRDGEFVAVVGPSGCGKTTLLKMIAGLIAPTAGSITVGGAMVKGPVRNIGIVFQQPVLLPWRSALDNVLLPLELMGRDPGASTDRALQLLSDVGLARFATRRPGELSGGMQQRVALCRSLVNNPSLLLMDEPFSALDEFTREGLNDQLLALWARDRMTAVFVTHSITEAVYLADRVAILTPHPGRLVGVVEVPIERPRIPSHRFRPDFVQIAQRIREALRA